MVCPNCGKDVMNVNGKNICVECGTEVAVNDDFSVLNQEPVTTDMPSPTFEETSAPSTEAISLNPDVPQAEANVSEALTTEMTVDRLVETPQDISIPSEENVPEPEVSTLDFTENQEIIPPVEQVEVSQPTEVYTPTVEETLATEQVVSESAVENIAPEIPLVDEVPTDEVPSVENFEQPIVNEVKLPVTETFETQPTEAPVVEKTPSFEQSSSETNPIASEVPQTNTEPIDPFESVAPLQSFDTTQNLNSGTEYLNSDMGQTEMPSTISDSKVNLKLLILLIGGGILLLLFIVGGVVAFNLLTKPVETPQIVNVMDSWKEYITDDYEVKFPLTPEKAKETYTVTEKQIEMQKVFSRADGVTYAVISGKLPEGFQPTSELSEFINALAKANNGQIDRTEIVEFENEQAVDYKISTEDRSIKGKVILKNGNIYYLQYISVDDTSTNYENFIESFNFKAQEIVE